jgi:hypothetical protein
MQSLNSSGYARKTLLVAGAGMFMAFLLLAPLAAFAQTGTVTVTTDQTSYQPGATITVSGTVTPAPTLSGTYVGISITTPTGVVADANEFAVAASTGTFSGTFTPGPTYTPNGTYTVTAKYSSYTPGTATFAFGNLTTTSSSQTGVTTTIYSDVTTTVSSVVTTASTIFSTAVSTVSAATTTTVSAATTTTIVESATSSGSGTAEAIAAVAIIIAIIAIIFAVLGMRKK